MRKELKAVICVVLSVWFFVMGFEIGSYHEKKEYMSTTVPNAVSSHEMSTTGNQYDAPTASTIPTTDLVDLTDPTEADQVDATTEADNSASNSVDPSSLSKEEILAKITEAMKKLENEQNFTARKVENTTINVVNSSASDAALKILNSVIQSSAGEKIANYSFVSGHATGVDDSGKTVKGEEDVTPRDVIPPIKDPNTFSLEIDGVKNATAESNGDGAIYTLMLVEESTTVDNPIPYHNTKAIGYLDLTSINVPGATFTKADRHYSGSVVTVTVDGDGRVTNIHYYLPMDGNGSAKMGFLSGDASFEGSNDEVWEFRY